MKVKDLIAQLQALDPEMLVLGPGYEGGLKEVEHVSVTEVALNVNTEWYYGPHEEPNSLEPFKGFDRAKGVLIT
jgi:hypothetical protein